MATAIVTQWTDNTLVAAGATAQSPWMHVVGEEKLHIIRTVTGGTYSLDIEWSRDGSTADITEAGVTTTNNGRAQIEVAAPYARVTVNNDHGTDAFTAHRTTVCSR